MVSRKAASHLPPGASNPQPSRWEQGRNGHCTLLPMAMTTMAGIFIIPYSMIFSIPALSQLKPPLLYTRVQPKIQPASHPSPCVPPHSGLWPPGKRNRYRCIEAAVPCRHHHNGKSLLPHHRRKSGKGCGFSDRYTKRTFQPLFRLCTEAPDNG